MKLRLFTKTKATAAPVRPGEALARQDAERLFAADYARLVAEARRYAVRWVGELWADDVVQETFLSMWEAYYSQGTPPHRRAEHLLYALLRNKAIDHKRGETTREAFEDQHTIDITHHLLPRLDAARVADGNLLEARVNYLVSAMPKTTASVFHAMMRNDWDLDTAAAELRMPYDTARGHFLRAKHRLAESLARDGYSIPPLKPRGRDGGRRS